jgi:4,5:9,10-diseco-3-hydroxy-5,9,17-trioxoandrosta-1(10),2-diene-4-oate hydrolase
MSKSPLLPEGQYANLPNGQTVHYQDLGTGPVVVFLHGSGSGASGHSNFKHNYPFLVENGYRVIVPDLIGYGYSDKPDDVEYPLEFFVECVKQLMDQLDVETYSLIGNSLGGAIAIKYTLDYPQNIDKLLLMAPGGLENQPDYFTMPGMAIMKEVFTSGAMDKSKLEDFIKRGLVYDDSIVDDELVQERWDIFVTQNTQVINTMKVQNMTEQLGEITCPTLSFWGADEKMMPETGIMKLARGIPHSRMVIVSECGHWVMVEHKEMFNRYTLDFLQHG